MDSLDQTLLGALRTDARMSVADLAKKLAVSRATVGNRIKRLEQSGVIVGPDCEVFSDRVLTLRAQRCLGEFGPTVAIEPETIHRACPAPRLRPAS